MQGRADASSVCKRDCASCSYKGCSLSEENRKNNPLYVKGYTNAEPLFLNIETIKSEEHKKHIQNHKKKYVFYNQLFGDWNARRNKQNRARYHANPEYRRQYAREWYRTHYVKQAKSIPEAIMPECGLDCLNCPHPDCILPEDWRRKASQANWKKNNPNYFAEYRAKNRELLREKGAKYREEHREEILKRQRARRATPEGKSKRAESDKRYRESHRESERERNKRWREENPEKYRAQLDKYNKLRRERRAAQKCLDIISEEPFRAS